MFNNSQCGPFLHVLKYYSDEISDLMQICTLSSTIYCNVETALESGYIKPKQYTRSDILNYEFLCIRVLVNSDNFDIYTYRSDVTKRTYALLFNNRVSTHMPRKCIDITRMLPTRSSGYDAKR